MALLALIGATCEADGHPSACTEPAPGTVQSTDAQSVSIGGTEIATHARADMHYPSHAHAHSTEQGCHDVQTHDLDPDQTHSVTVNGSPVYLVGDSATDPGSGGTADVLDAGGNGSVSIG